MKSNRWIFFSLNFCMCYKIVNSLCIWKITQSCISHWFCRIDLHWWQRQSWSETMSDLKDKCHVLSTLSFNRKDLPQQPLHLMEAGGDGIKTFPKESQCQTVAQHKKKKKSFHAFRSCHLNPHVWRVLDMGFSPSWTKREAWGAAFLEEHIWASRDRSFQERTWPWGPAQQLQARGALGGSTWSLASLCLFTKCLSPEERTAWC